MSVPPNSFAPGKVPDLQSLIWLRGSAADVTTTGKRLKLAVMIQPNCPGCMMHALPVGNNLWRRSKQMTPLTLPQHLSTGSNTSSSNNNTGITIVGGSASQQLSPNLNANNTSNTANNNVPQELMDRLFTVVDVYCVTTAFEDFQYNNLDSARLLLTGKHVGESLARLGPDVRPQCQPCMSVAHDIVVDKKDAPSQLLELALASSKESARKRLGSIVPPEELDAHFATVGREILPQSIPVFFYCAGANGTPSWVLHIDDGTVLECRFGWISEMELIDWMINHARKVGL
eukprot:CAMPEP_0113514746 /NCGR_PEP_ID=MMETSP0014_2-20120614/40574_1 /TAXON_ID=2857 /ORGANISM="Nitzschia sp." /LENGTH=287 /DNA_ID=CAMNT_0000411265 /DNA_START=147 /DNA_END=1010 /DNA_ORIENTATION=- /assembly_acc=CAM_ASM_000159